MRAALSPLPPQDTPRYDAFISLNTSPGGSQLGFALGITMGSIPSFPDEGEFK
jgi:hypothetical protein